MSNESGPDFTRAFDLCIAASDAAKHEELREVALDAIREPYQNEFIPDEDRRIVYGCEMQIKDRVEEWVYELLDTLPRGRAYDGAWGIITDFVSIGLACVDWREVARDYLESVEYEPTT